jgi:hypothetical protein
MPHFLQRFLWSRKPSILLEQETLRDYSVTASLAQIQLQLNALSCENRHFLPAIWHYTATIELFPFKFKGPLRGSYPMHLHMHLMIDKSNTTCTYSQGLRVINYIAPSHAPIQWIASDDCQIWLHTRLFPVDCIWLITVIHIQPHIYVNGSGSLGTFQSTLPSFPEGRLRRIGFAKHY